MAVDADLPESALSLDLDMPAAVAAVDVPRAALPAVPRIPLHRLQPRRAGAAEERLAVRLAALAAERHAGQASSAAAALA